MGSTSDDPTVQETVKVLQELGIDYEIRVLSAHKKPRQVMEYASNARERGLEWYNCTMKLHYHYHIIDDANAIG